jgi:hypothetical protein
MTEPANLERGYRRLMAAYPQSFRREQEEEMLAVLMAGARGQRRPSLAETVDVMKSGLGMRLRRAWSVPDQGWADALLVVSVAAPLLVLVAGLLEVAVPYPLPPANRDLALFGWSHFVRSPVPREIGGLSLLHLPGFDIAIGGQVIIAVVVLLGMRWLGLAVVAAAAAGFWLAAARVLGGGIPEPMWVLGTAALPLEALALIAVPGGRQVRWVLRWREGIALLLAAVTIQVLTLMSDATSPFARTSVFLGHAPVVGGKVTRAYFYKDLPLPGLRGYVAVILVLAAAVTALALTLKVGRYFLLIVALCYPVIMDRVITSAGPGLKQLAHPANGHLYMLYLPPLLLAGIMIVACSGQRLRAVRQPRSA